MENALIKKADMFFTDACGKSGRNFVCELSLELAYGGVNIKFNPLRVPQLLEQLGLECFSELEGTYIQITDTPIGGEVRGIKSIMAKNNEKLFKTENNIYFGSNFIKLLEKELKE